MKKLILALTLLLAPLSVNAERTMIVEARCGKISENPITYLCATKNLYRYKFPPLWIVRDYKGRIVDTTYGWNIVRIFPQPGPFSFEVYRNNGTSAKDLILKGEAK